LGSECQTARHLNGGDEEQTMAEREIAPETWRAIPGHDGYEASDLGRIRSVDKKIWIRNRWEYYCWRSYRGRVLKTPRNGNYLRAKLGEHDNGYDVHTLVMLAFHGPRPKGKTGISMAMVATTA